MRRFIHGSDTAFADLERRARRGCVVFYSEEMPPGSVPARARVGMEVNPDNGHALLFVQRGVAYYDRNLTVKEWLDAGEKPFPSFAHLRHWIQDELSRCYGSGEIAVRPEDLTDMEAVRRDMPDQGAGLYVDEGALFSEMRTHVRGQDDALRMLSRRISRHLARRIPARPATLFAVGPTGVGKTKTAEALPHALRTLDSAGASYGYLRLDMAEYQERHRVSQLLGAPQGYVGYGEGAQLVDALATNPRTVVLFDEIEKAHPDVMRALMNAMDAGRLSTAAAKSHGRDVDCRYAIFLFTSNLDATGILQDLEARKAFHDPIVVDEICRRRLRAAGIAPELAGRIGCFLVFRPLSADTRAEIVALAIVRVASEYGVHVGRIAPSVIVSILNQAHSDGLGARPDEYLVDDQLGACFATASHITSPVEVRGGPPFECVPFDSPEVIYTYEDKP